MTDQEAKGWCVLELMGHRKLAGFISDGGSLLRIDIYLNDPDVAEAPAPPLATQWYGPSAIYCITATTKEMCLQLTESHQPAPVGRWELPEQAATAELEDAHIFDEEDDRGGY
jgi:hypothetical protein